jgi:hypothetical protein
MIVELAALLLLQAIPQNWTLKALPSTAEARDAAFAKPSAEMPASVGPESPVRAAAPSEPVVTLAPVPDSGLPMRDVRLLNLSLQPRPEHSDEPSRRKWLALMIAQHGAASFDAWSTRRAISSGQYQELNPTLRPFAGNASLYGAIQVGPLAFDYVGRRMMTSQHAWMRHVWWIPQALSTAMSLGSGAHNLH